VNVVLHESVHATFYISGQAFFDESIANYVADGLTLDYLSKTYGAESKELKSYVRAESDYETRRKSIHEAYEKLNGVYSSGQTDESKKVVKEQILGDLNAKLKPKHPINNATLIQFKTYHVGMDEFDELFRSCGRSWQRFWGAIKNVSEKSFKKSQQEDLGPIILPLVRAGCS
ncbi:MAG: aminopeptidase, partial [Bdellovibrionota bacterium]